MTLNKRNREDNDALVEWFSEPGLKPVRRAREVIVGILQLVRLSLRII